MKREFYNEIVQDIRNYQGKQKDFKSAVDDLYSQAKEYFDTNFKERYNINFEDFISNPHDYIQYTELINFYGSYDRELRQIGINLGDNATFLVIDNKYTQRSIFAEDIVRCIAKDISFDNWTYAYELSDIKRLDTEIGYFEWDITEPNEQEEIGELDETDNLEEIKELEEAENQNELEEMEESNGLGEQKKHIKEMVEKYTTIPTIEGYTFNGGQK